MSQVPSNAIGPNKSGLAYRTEDNARARAINTLNSGAAAPGYAEQGLPWLDTSSTPWRLRVHDGSNWITLGEINAATDTFTPYLGTAALRLINQAADTGAADAYVVAPVPAVHALSTGHIVTLRPANTNTGASTLTVSSVGAMAIKMQDGSDLHAGALRAGGAYLLVYTGAFFVLMNPTYSFGGLAFLDVLNEPDFASDSEIQPPSQRSVREYLEEFGGGGGEWEPLASASWSSTMTSVDFTDIFEDGHDTFAFDIACTVSNTNSVIQAQLSTNGGASYIAGSSYHPSRYNLNPASVSAQGSAQLIKDEGSAGFARRRGWAKMIGATNPDMPTVINALGAARSTSTDVVSALFETVVTVNTVAAVNAVRIICGPGSMSSGTINCYGRKEWPNA
jgi:hypothetical protein